MLDPSNPPLYGYLEVELVKRTNFYFRELGGE